MESITLICPSCKSTCFKQDEKCEFCNFPLKGTEKEKAVFIGQKYAKKQRTADGSKTINRNRYLLFALGGLKLIAIIYSFKRLEFYDMLFNLTIAIALIGLGIYAKKQPFWAFVLALFFYLGIQLLIYLINPANIFLGLIWQIIIICSLILGIIRGADLRK